MDFKVLPIANPPISSYANHAFYLSVLSCSDDYLGWFFSNYIQLKCVDYRRGSIWFDFYTLDPAYHYNPLLTTTSQVLQREMLSISEIDIVDFIINCIDADFYVHINIDESYIPQSPRYKQSPFFHPVFIYGYNRLKRSFNVSGFFNNYKYESVLVDFDLVKQGYTNAKPDHNNLWINRLQLYKKNPSSSYEFDINCVIEGLKEYHGSIPSDQKIRHFEKPDQEAFFGLKTYEYLEEYLDIHQNNTYGVDIRPFHVLWEHKKTMNARLNYMNRFGTDLDIFISQYDSLEKRALEVRNMVLKYNITRESGMLARLKCSLNNIFIKEKNILEEMIPVLERSKHYFDK
ncbi:hypothetical protein [Paenibacillus sp. OAE614]|uniref:hypothetical protein n=1 Tax=Paenibacillus sp. OAE614 TaxID=2663804 RepID=UPI00178A79D9